MHTKLPCGCRHNDTHWLHRCDKCAADDAIVSARWANDKANPPKVTVHRINGVVLQNAAFAMPEVETVSPEVMKAMIPPLQEATCPEPTPLPTSGSEDSATPTSEPQIDYSALLNLL